jgi:hypothetical protein
MVIVSAMKIGGLIWRQGFKIHQLLQIEIFHFTSGIQKLWCIEPRRFSRISECRIADGRFDNRITIASALNSNPSIIRLICQQRGARFRQVGPRAVELIFVFFRSLCK